MENLLVTTFLYIIIFGILCGFNKNKPATITETTSSATIKVSVIAPSTIEQKCATTNNALNIESLVEDEIFEPMTGINSQTLACIFEDRDIPPVPAKTTRKRSKKKNISGFIKEIEAST